ncbi:SusD/RagB family nutrient-binding outer membrane lipoprotein [Mucilaginibacter celer]|uniref:SusD/RagB family nutrient-binding outer membrane lipoprotein n=1 Tax=Mucilaginibacter celer TaxID=2305508 RepID=A0A494VXK1_9SPHI|nr:SusD/RagB family nutrient-binding outer membrane lipoprotein [Mucilaginibacter celer]AYL96203.1 SusD/RagB family nutrient-binding outer membrane lipoprotein [Mucilaginibacter celer]
MKKIYLYTIASALTLFGAGCNKIKDFGDVNNNPGATVTPIPSALLSNVEVGLGGYASTGTEAISGGQYAQYFTETQYSGTSLYNLPQNSFAGNYGGNLNNLQIIIRLNPNKNMVNVAKILQQYIFWIMTDSWGDIPYSEALQGSANITPKFDAQQDIYKGMLSTLTTAINSFDSSPISGDLIYGGDVASWKRMANSLKLLISVQMSKVASVSALGSTSVKEAIASGVIENYEQNFILKYPGGPYKSPWWNLYNGRKDFAESKTLTDYTKSTSDPRQALFGGDSEQPGRLGTSDVGVPYGLARLAVTAFTDANPNWARVLRGDKRLENGSVTLITAAEVWLARSEAASLGWTTEVVATDFTNGIKTSFDQWGLDGDGTGATFAAKLIKENSNSLDIKLISTQRWVASYPDGHMAWNIWRKSGFPLLTPAPDHTNSSGQIVRRFVYVPDEYSTNGKNVTAAAARMGGDSQDTKVWWDGGN